MDVDVYYALLEKVQKVDWNKDSRNEHFVFFRLNGYTEKLKELAEKNRNIVLA